MKNWRYALTGMVFLAALMGAVFVARTGRPKLEAEKYDPRRAQGSPQAAIEIVEYSDFQCPACQKAQALLSNLMEQYPGKIRLYYRHFPLESHPFSPLAHQAAECAAEQDHFWPYHNRLYQEQEIWSAASAAPPVEIFLRYARELGLDLDSFARCLTEPTIAQRIQEERVAGSGLGIRSTPSFFVNGELVVGGQELIRKMETVVNE